jgi:M6 family metalloprotease-like protein
MRIYTFLAMAVFAVLICSPLQAAFLSNMPVNITQPDGAKIECLASGDEYHNWLHDKDNYTIIRNPANGYYCYAEQNGTEVVAGSLVVGRDTPQSRGLTPGVNISETAYKARRNTMFQAPVQRNAPTTGTINNIVIYIRFSDESEFGDNISLYDGWFNTGTSSQKNYFLEASYNQLTVNTTFYPAAVNNLVVSWQDSHARAYFQPYDATTNPTGYNGDLQRTSREFTLLQNATNGVSSQIPSGLTIDSDGDGRVDNVVYIIKGAAGAWSSLLWPHRWALYDRYVYINGKRVYDFNLQLQTFLTTRAVGVLCHEFFHTLGAPDLYHYTSNGISPAGSWDIMQSDQNPPQHMTAFMKWKYGHWISSIPTISADQQYTINPLTSSTGNAYRINSNDANQYYVVEFRKKTGTFENSIPGSGLLVYRIDTSCGDGNADGPPDELYIYRPGGTTTADGTVSSANFSLETGRNKINNSTNPTPFLQNGSEGNLSLYGIGSSAGTSMSFYKGVAPIVTIDFATNPQTEGFDVSSVIPEGWENQPVSGTKIFERVTSGGSPTCSPQSGAGMLRYNSYSAANGNSAYLATPRIDCNNTSLYSYSFAFWMYRDTGYTTNADRMEVYLNTAQNLSGSPTLLGTINRYTNMAPVVGSAGWYQYAYNLTLPASGYYYIVLKAISAYGNNMFVDSFSYTRTVIPPNAAINPTPANLATGQNFNQILSWESGGGNPTAYKLYLGTNNPPSNLMNGSNLGNVLSYSRPGGLPLGSTLYWKIVPLNAGGNAPNCPVWSFSTIADTSVFPLAETFGTAGTSFPPANWTRYAGQLTETTTLVANTGLWIQDDWLNTVSAPVNYCARNNIYGTSRYGWLMSPLLNLPANAMLSFDLGLTDYGSSNPITSDPNGSSGTDDQFAVLIGDGSTWTSANLLRRWDNAGSAYIFNNISPLGDKIYLDLSAYAGYKYIAFYGASSISNADNDLFVDNVSLQIKPSTPTVSCSPDVWDAGVRELNSSLSKQITVYNAGAGTLSISSISLSGNNAFALTGLPSFPVNLAFGQSTTFSARYYPTTTGVHSAEIAIHSSSTVYITLSGSSVDPRIISLPYTENMDAVTAPSLPLGWRAYISSGSTSAAVVTTVTYPVSSPNSVSIYNSSDAAADIRLISPEIIPLIGSSKLKLSARGGSTGYQLLVGTVSNADGSGVFTQLNTINLSNVHTEYTVALDNYAGSDRYIALKHGLGATYRSIYIDDFRLEALLDNDLSISDINGFGLGVVGESMQYRVSVTNNGLTTQSAYTVKLMAEDNRMELASLQINSPLLPDETTTHTLAWVPGMADNYQIYALLILESDGNLANNSTATSSATVLPGDMYLPLAGDEQTETTANTLPLSLYWKNSLSESIYLAEEMMMASGNLTGLVYKGNFVQELNNKPLKVWMKNTSESDLALGWSSFGDYTLVFDGFVNFPLGTNLVSIPLSTPFAYSGANLAIRVNRPMDTEYFSINNHFFYTDTPDSPNRSRYVLSDTVLYDPAAPSAAGTLSSSIPLTAFIVADAALATPVLSIQQQGSNIVLMWNEINGAKEYRLYTSEDPYNWSASYISIANPAHTYTYNAAVNGRTYFKVIASADTSRGILKTDNNKRK